MFRCVHTHKHTHPKPEEADAQRRQPIPKAHLQVLELLDVFSQTLNLTDSLPRPPTQPPTHPRCFLARSLSVCLPVSLFLPLYFSTSLYLYAHLSTDPSIHPYPDPFSNQPTYVHTYLPT